MPGLPPFFGSGLWFAHSDQGDPWTVWTWPTAAKRGATMLPIDVTIRIRVTIAASPINQTRRNPSISVTRKQAWAGYPSRITGDGVRPAWRKRHYERARIIRLEVVVKRHHQANITGGSDRARRTHGEARGSVRTPAAAVDLCVSRSATALSSAKCWGRTRSLTMSVQLLVAG